MPEAPDHRVQPESVAMDLVGYLIVVVSDLDALANLALAVADLVERATIRILDLVVVTKDSDGAVSALEIDAVDSLAALRHMTSEFGGLLSDHDIELASLALRPGTSGLVLVTEDRWAEPLSLAAQRGGGQIIAGERIPASRIESALAERLDEDRRRP